MNALKLNRSLLKVPLYVAGKSAEEVQQELGLQQVIKLASNENPLGPSPRAVAAFQQALGQAHRYPGLAERDLRRRLADHHGLSEGHIIVGNGGTDVLRMIAQGFIFDGGQSVMGRVTFPLYRLLTLMFGGEPVPIEPGPGLALDLPAMAQAVGEATRVLWLCSPNNPTGLTLTQAEVDALVETLPAHVVLVLDESYLAYVTQPDAVDAVQHVRQGRPVISVRSFSKTAGLANLRLGYGIGDPEIIEYLMHTVLPFNTGGPAMQAAMASLDDHDHAHASQELVRQEREFLRRRMGELGLSCLPSQANFVLALDVPGGGQAFADELLHWGVIVRPMQGFGVPSAVRVSVGTRPENERLLQALEEVMNGVRQRQG